MENALKRAYENKMNEFAMSSDLPVEHIIRPYILDCPPDLPLFEAARRMSQARCSSIVVMAGGKVVGIWTERDALGLDFSDPQVFSLPIAAVMSSPVKTIPQHMPMREVALRFKEDGVRHYLVVSDDGDYRGVISQTDVILNQGVEHYLRLRDVKSALHREPPLVAATEPFSAAARQMRKNGFDAAVVMEDGHACGIITERDIVRLIANNHADSPVGEVASKPLITVRQDDSLYHVRNLLVEQGIRHVGVVDEQGGFIGLLSFSDILSDMEYAYVRELQDALRERDAALSLSKRHLQLAEKIIEASLEGIMVTDPEGVIQMINPAFTRLTGYTLAEVIGRKPNILASGKHDRQFYEEMWAGLHANGYWQGEVWNRRKDGSLFPELLTITAIKDEEGRTTHYAALFSDITRLKENEERIRRLAYYDNLTGLPNRRLFNDRLSVALAHAHRSRQKLAVMFLDLDRFKRVNDSLGHNIGDYLLREVAHRIRNCIREDDTVARVAGDEFIILLPEIAQPDDAAKTARRIIDSIKRPINIDGKELLVTSSIGISIYPEDGATAETLIKNADAAMYRAKDLGRNSYQLYTPAINARSFEHLAMERSLHRALERSEFTVYFQPVVELETRRIVAAEALLRWRHPDLGLVSPAEFIPIAEETGLIHPIGQWITRAVCEQIRAWQHQGLRLVPVAINMSAQQFKQQNPAAEAKRILLETGVDPACVTFELTESVIMKDAEAAVAMLQQFHAMGCGIAIDDFGTGYSSLSYLKRFPVSALKVDRTFVHDIPYDKDAAAIVAAVINLAHSLRLTVIAEGVETEAQLDFLREQGCDHVQGFLLGHPLPAADFSAQHLQKATVPPLDKTAF